MSTDDNFEPLAAALEPWFESEKKFDELPEEVQELIKRVLGPALAQVLWNAVSPRWRRNMAQWWDIHHHPALARERNALAKKSEEINECKRTASNLRVEDRTMEDVELQDTKLRRLRTEEEAIEAVMRQKVKDDLGLAWPADDCIPENAWIPENVSEESFRVVKNEPGGGGRARRGHHRHRVIDEMFRQVKNLEITLDEFTSLSQPALAERFGVSRSTSEPARKEVLARLRAEWLALPEKHKKTDPGRKKTDCGS